MLSRKMATQRRLFDFVIPIKQLKQQKTLTITNIFYNSVKMEIKKKLS